MAEGLVVIGALLGGALGVLIVIGLRLDHISHQMRDILIALRKEEE